MSHEPHGARDDAEGNNRGVSVMLATTTLFAIMNALTKHVATLYPAPQILWIRYMIFAAYGLAETLRRRGRWALKSNAPYLQVTRGLLLATEILMYIVAIRYMPLADIQAITGGSHAMGEVTVRVVEGGLKTTGHGVSTDVIEASAKAYVDALNRLDLRKARHEQRVQAV